jgi:putative membrane protein
MIIRDKSNIFNLLFSWRGTILPKVLPSLAVVMLASAVTATLTYYGILHVPQVPAIGFTIFGVILSIFWAFVTMPVMTAGGKVANSGAR